MTVATSIMLVLQVLLISLFLVSGQTQGKVFGLRQWFAKILVNGYILEQ